MNPLLLRIVSEEQSSLNEEKKKNLHLVMKSENCLLKQSVLRRKLNPAVESAVKKNLLEVKMVQVGMLQWHSLSKV